MARYKSRATRAGDAAQEWRDVAQAVRDAETAEAANEAMGKFDASEFEALKEEMESWRDNMSGASMEHLPKFEEVSQACDELDGIDVSEFDGKEFEAPQEGEEFDASDAADALESAADELENVSFPGMY